MSGSRPPQLLGDREQWIARRVQAAAELDESERELFLRRVCGGDADLRREVEAQLAARLRGEGANASLSQNLTQARFEDGSSSNVTTRLGRSDDPGRGPMPDLAQGRQPPPLPPDGQLRRSPPPPAFLVADRQPSQPHYATSRLPTPEHPSPLWASGIVGERIHNYEVVSKIGQGGMGVVYLARHLFIDRSAALKVLHPHLQPRVDNDPNLVGRFMNEARAANAIRHPNIIEVVDTGFLPRSGAPYLLMEYLEGESLGARLRNMRRLPLEMALQIAGQTASALSAAHDQGIVHRDLKPENIFLLPRPGNVDLVKVLDFGIAKLRLDLAGQAVQTQPGTLVGTPRYMSPEQCRGTGEVDHRSDIYALGIILYEMLCGVPPFQGEGVGQLLAVHMTEPPPPLRVHASDIPRYIEEACLRALAKRPEDRFQSMREFRAALGSAALVPITPPTGTINVADTSGYDLGSHPSYPAVSQSGLRAGAQPPRRGLRRFAVAAALSLVAGAVFINLRSRSPRAPVTNENLNVPSSGPAPLVDPAREPPSPMPGAERTDAAVEVPSPRPTATAARPAKEPRRAASSPRKPKNQNPPPSAKKIAPESETPAPPPRKTYVPPLWE
jgi:eukaryotic-like serine/threonine-protein kinase